MVNFEEIQNHFNIEWIECKDDNKLSKYEEWFHILEKQCDLTYHSPDSEHYMKVEWISEYIKFYIYYQDEDIWGKPIGFYAGVSLLKPYFENLSRNNLISRSICSTTLLTDNFLYNSSLRETVESINKLKKDLLQYCKFQKIASMLKKQEEIQQDFKE